MEPPHGKRFTLLQATPIPAAPLPERPEVVPPEVVPPGRKPGFPNLTFLSFSAFLSVTIGFTLLVTFVSWLITNLQKSVDFGTISKYSRSKMEAASHESARWNRLLGSSSVELDRRSLLGSGDHVGREEEEDARRLDQVGLGNARPGGSTTSFGREMYDVAYISGGEDPGAGGWGGQRGHLQGGGPPVTGAGPRAGSGGSTTNVVHHAPLSACQVLCILVYDVLGLVCAFSWSQVCVSIFSSAFCFQSNFLTCFSVVFYMIGVNGSLLRLGRKYMATLHSESQEYFFEEEGGSPFGDVLSWSRFAAD